MKIKEKVKGTLSNVFNVLSGKKGADAAFLGKMAVTFTALAVVSAAAIAVAPVALGTLATAAIGWEACSLLSAAVASKEAKKFKVNNASQNKPA